MRASGRVGVGAGHPLPGKFKFLKLNSRIIENRSRILPPPPPPEYQKKFININSFKLSFIQQ